MIFHSFDFLIFFLVTLGLYWCLPHRAQNVLLLVASYVFYGYVHPWFLYLIAASTIVDYAMALAMERWPGRKKTFLLVSLISNFGMLGFFKYFNFFVDNVIVALRRPGRRDGAAQPAHRAAGRHLVLHVPDAQLHDRRLPRAA